MTVIPFGSAQPELVAEHENNTVTWRYQDNGAGGILYAGDYVRASIRPPAKPVSQTLSRTPAVPAARPLSLLVSLLVALPKASRWNFTTGASISR